MDAYLFRFRRSHNTAMGVKLLDRRFNFCLGYLHWGIITYIYILVYAILSIKPIILTYTRAVSSNEIMKSIEQILELQQHRQIYITVDCIINFRNQHQEGHLRYQRSEHSH